MSKKQIEKVILSKSRRATHFSDNRFRWGDILKYLSEEKIELQDSDILEVGFTGGWDEGDSARDDAYDLKVIRVRQETEEEYQKRISKQKEKAENIKKRRYENYLKLKKEFEND
jgi:hypothetical protein